MRPRDREDSESPPPSSPTPAAITAPPRAGVGLSSMVVRPSESGGSGTDPEPEDTRGAHDRKASAPHPRGPESPQPPRRRDESPSAPRFRYSSPPVRRRRSPLDRPRKQSPPAGFRRRDSPTGPRRRRSAQGFNHQSQRFHDDLGYAIRGDPDMPLWRNRPDYRSPDLDHPVRSPIGHGGRIGRFRDVSPPYERGVGGGSFGRGYSVYGRGRSSLEGDYAHRNDPNLSPREGDWICRNPSCGNLNFARRTYCNKCDEFRFGAGMDGASRSSRRGYYSPPVPPRASPPRFPIPYTDRDLRRDTNGYRSPSHGWGTAGPSAFGSGSPPGREGRFADHLQRDRLEYRDDDYRGRRKFDLPLYDQWDSRNPGPDGFMPERRGFSGRSRSPPGRWVRDSRERSRSPLAKRELRGGFMSKGQDDRPYDGSFVGRGRRDSSHIVRSRGRYGRGYGRGDDAFTGQGGRGGSWKER